MGKQRRPDVTFLIKRAILSRMVRARRRLSRSLTVISLLLCAASAVLWIRSYSGRDVFTFRHSTAGQWTEFAFGTNRGLCAFSRFDMPETERATVERYLFGALGKLGFSYVRAEPTRGPDGNRWWNKLGFARETSTLITGLRTGSTIIFMPMWLLVVLFATIPAARLLGHLRRRAARRGGRCTVCGYDLRATPGRCPECGAVPEGFAATGVL